MSDGLSAPTKHSADYCSRCDGYSAEVGPMDENGRCRGCRYAVALQQIRDREWVENALDPQWAAGVAREALGNV